MILSKKDLNKNLDSFFWQLKNNLGNDFQDVLDEFDIDFKNYRKVPVTKMLPLLTKFNVSLDLMMKGSVDFECLINQHHGIETLPSKYLDKGAFSSRYTAIAMLNFIKKELGNGTSEMLLKHLQLKKSHFSDFKEKNNFLLPMDLLNYIFSYYGPKTVEKMGESSVEILSNSASGDKLSNCKNLSEMFSLFFEEIAPASVEKNYLWNIKKQTDGKIIICGKPNPQIKEIFGIEDVIISEPATLQRKGFLKGMPSILGDYKVDASVTRKLNAGEVQDYFELTYRQDPIH